MKVLVTGGTGYVGSWITVALMEAGHDVRQLVRRREQVALTFRPHGVEPSDVVVGDVTDPAVVKEAVDGCDAVVHAAAVFSFDPRRRTEVVATNVAATRLVLDAALAAGCDPVVHVSSYSALVRRGGSSTALPLGDLTGTYVGSKIESERVARDLQDDGRPVVIVHPGSVIGPDDPYFGESAVLLEWVARGRMTVFPKGGMHVTDVRDVADVVVSALKPGGGPRRYVVPGHHVRGPELFGAVGEAVGRRRRHVPAPPGAVALLMRAAAPAWRLLPAGASSPMTPDGPTIVGRDTVLDTGPAERELDVHARPFAASVRDTIGWMVDTGRLPEKYRPG